MKTSLTLAAAAILVTELGAVAFPASAQPTDTVGISHAACTASAALVSMTPVDLPPIARLEGLAGTAVVRVDLDASGVARAATISASSGSMLLDRIARQSALTQTYAPEVRDCTRVAGSYLVSVDLRS